MADLLDRKLKISTKEFFYKLGYQMQTELNVNEFITKICPSLKLTEYAGLTVFKSIDTKTRGLITIYDLYTVINSYRNNSSYEMNDEDGSGNAIKNKYNLSEIDVFWIKKLSDKLLKSNSSITPKMLFDISRIKNEDEISLDLLKRKLNTIVFKNELQADDLNLMIEALNINKNNKINYEDFNNLLSISKNDNKVNASNNQNIDENNTLPLRQNNNILQKFKFDNQMSADKSSIPLNNENTNSNVVTQNNFTQSQYSNKKQPTNSNETIKTKNEKTSLPFLKKSMPNDINLKNFLDELDVFESGEWSLIEILESFRIDYETENFPIQDLFMKLKEKFHPTISLNKIKTCVDNIDKDKDGYFSYLDLINFLNENMNYDSIKLGWKLITTNIFFTRQKTPEEFFTENFQKKSKRDSGNNYQYEISFIDFTKLLIREFKLPPSLSKEMYDDLQNLLFNHKITKGDLIDTVNRQKEYDTQEINDKKLEYQNNKENLLSVNNSNKDNGISLLDKNYFEEQMKKFVGLLQKGLVPSNSQNIKNTFTKNLISFLRLPDKMNLYQFRKLFINPLQMDLSLGIGLFQLVKSYNKTNEEVLPTIKTDDLFSILLSYIDNKINTFEPKLFLYYLENGNYISLKNCFEAIQYNPDGITSIDLLNHLEMFYPDISAYILKEIIICIDENSKGIVNFKNLNDFLKKSSSKEENRFSENLILKHCASILDRKKISTFKFLKKSFGFKNKDIKNGSGELYVGEQEHKKYFADVLGLNYSECQKLQMFLSVVKNKKSYPLDRLCKFINFYRIEKN